ncbi:MAG TPA: phytanoyl-CoA dioxygenase family protein [Candidatus Dormibacteraeota bacterium]|nr:phytanoyl-CoA dioxygenase family protein [Candidatus Dormibacteraeota bacterium]
MSESCVQDAWAESLAQFHDSGAVVLSDLYPSDLVRRACDELPSLLAEQGPHTFKESDGETVRAVYGLHGRDGVWREMAELPALHQVIADVLGEEYYLFQWKINPKAPTTGEEWEWHRDFVYWHLEDGMPAPHAVTAAVFLSDVTPASGPTQVIRGSHRLPLSGSEQRQLGRRERGQDDEEDWTVLVANGLPYTVSNDEADRLCAVHGVVEGVGAPGSALLFHSNAIHGSRPNTSESLRVVAFLTFNPVANEPRQASPRPGYFVNKDPVPLSRLARGGGRG